MENSQFVSKSEWNSYINASATELYDLLVAASEDYVLSSATLSLTSGTDTYPLPGDFYKLRGVDLVLDAQGNAVTLQPFNFAERNNYIFTPTWNVVGLSYLRYRIQGNSIRFVPVPSNPATIKLWYVPALATLSADSDTLDGVDGWEEFVVIDAAIKAKDKEESDVSVLAAQRAAIIKRIEAMASSRDAGMPHKIADTSRMMPWEFWSFAGKS
jgi:hypothetical protein